MIHKTNFAVVSKKALENGHIGFAYRKPSDGPQDSGWRMMYDRNEDALDLANPDKVYNCTIGRLLKRFPEIKTFLNEKTRSVVEEIDGDYKSFRTDKELSDVPNLMSGKNRYMPYTGVAVTADPAEMRTHIKEPWETMLPK